MIVFAKTQNLYFISKFFFEKKTTNATLSFKHRYLTNQAGELDPVISVEIIVSVASNALFVCKMMKSTYACVCYCNSYFFLFITDPHVLYSIGF